MSKTSKAVLLSALVFPGTGHFLLKKSVAGAVLFGASLGALYYLVVSAVEQARKIVEKIQSGEIQLDGLDITELVSNQLSGSETQTQSVATVVLILSWLIGIVDSYRVGRIQDKDTEC